jgi:ankyrin repeat protein
MEEGEGKGYYPLAVASAKGHVDVIEALIAGGADPNQVGGELSWSSLHTAAQFNQPGAVAALVKAGANINLANCHGDTPLSCAAFHGHREAMVALLLARAAVNIANIEGVSPLYIAVQEGRVEILKLLIKAKGDVNQCVKEDGFSPLMVASGRGFVEAVELLLLNGANVHLKNNDGITALDVAILEKHPSVEAVLRAHIAKLEAEREGEGEGERAAEGK